MLNECDRNIFSHNLNEKHIVDIKQSLLEPLLLETPAGMNLTGSNV